MTIATMTDRTLPLAELVASALAAAARGIRSDEIASISDLVADIAAADRLARACSAWIDATDDPDVPMIDVEPKEAAMNTAHIAYRARMAQEVTDD